jgi:hypothetical protein
VDWSFLVKSESVIHETSEMTRSFDSSYHRVHSLEVCSFVIGLFLSHHKSRTSRNPNTPFFSFRSFFERNLHHDDDDNDGDDDHDEAETTATTTLPRADNGDFHGRLISCLILDHAGDGRSLRLGPGAAVPTSFTGTVAGLDDATLGH